MQSVACSQPAGRKPCVLIVDDERFIRRLIASWLQDEGYTCLLAANAEDANLLINSHSVDVITSDINMPGISGAEWVPRLHHEHPDIAVLMLTGCEDIRQAIWTLTQGASGYLIKPVDKQEIAFQVSRALERQRMLTAQRDHTQLLECKVHEQTRLIRESHEETIERLIAASRVHDDETGEHIRRLGLLSAIVAGRLGWPQASVDMIRLAAPMHDIGKVGIPDDILRKPAKLSPEEYDVMKKHTDIGAQILAGSKLPMLQMAELIARSHHERWDGHGYPDGLAGTRIPMAARIVAVVDVFDALSHDRVYRTALPTKQVLEIMRDGCGTQFDPSVLEAFFESLPQIRRVLEDDPSQPDNSLVMEKRQQKTLDEEPADTPTLASSGTRSTSRKAMLLRSHVAS